MIITKEQHNKLIEICADQAAVICQAGIVAIALSPDECDNLENTRAPELLGLIAKATIEDAPAFCDLPEEVLKRAKVIRKKRYGIY